jgi:regulator of PEP synthase PpsR (kinase-PPPase family)
MTEQPAHSIFIVSGGVGASGEQLVYTVLAQFPRNQVRVVTFPNVRVPNQIEEIVQRAKKEKAILVHTLVDEKLREEIKTLANELDVFEMDLMGSLFEHLTRVLGTQPAGQPGLYRLLNQTYYDRVAAIDFAMAHDDGKNPETLHQAEIVLVGVSRSGKTPLSLYLSVLGWKVANVPVVLELDLPEELFKIDRQRVFGLDIETGQLLLLRQQRQRHLGTPGPSDYTDPEKIYSELEKAKEICQRYSFSVIKVTDKPIESSADEVIRLMTSRFKLSGQR